MKLEKIKLYFVGALLVIGLTAALLYFDNSVLDSIYLKIDIAYTISEPIIIDTMSINAGTDYIYTFLLEINGMSDLPNTTSTGWNPIFY